MTAAAPCSHVKSFAAKCIEASVERNPSNLLPAATRNAINTPASPSPAIIPDAASTPGSLSSAFPLRRESTMRRTMPPTKSGESVLNGR
jgi:hypothetical protein